jgi:V8-like Glu-specific endopeptidase
VKVKRIKEFLFLLLWLHEKSLLYCIVNHAMNYKTDTEPGSSGSDVLSENTKAIKEIQVKLNEIVPSLQDSINLTTIKDLESRVSNLEEKVDQIFKILESRKIN